MFGGPWCRHLDGLASSPRRAGALSALTLMTFRSFPEYWHYANEVAFNTEAYSSPDVPPLVSFETLFAVTNALC